MKEKDINKIIQSDELYNEEIETLQKEIEMDFSKRLEPVSFYFKKKNIIKEFNKGNFLTYLILLRPFNKFKVKVTEEFYFNVKDIYEMEKYFDRIIEFYQIEKEIEIGETLVEIIDKINYIDCKMNKMYGPTIDLLSIIELAERNKEFEKILYHPEIKFSASAINAEKIMKITNDKVKKLKEIIVNDGKTSLAKFIQSGSGVNLKQLGQLFGVIGLKPDLREKIIPFPIDTNFALGLKNIEHFYINATGCLKALLTSHNSIKDSGYLTRKLGILSIDTFIDKEVDDCGTKHLLPIKIENETYLKFLHNRWYLEDDEDEEYKLLNEEDTDLIGKTILLRSPITCACKHGICKTCYGELYKVNQNMNIGIIAILILTNLISQRLLSAKHLLTAVVKMIGWDPRMLDYFDIFINRIIKKEDANISIKIKKDHIDTNEESEVDQYEINQFIIVDDNKEIVIDLHIVVTLNEYLNELLESVYDEENDVYVFKNKNLVEINSLFSFQINNNGLTRALIEITNLIEKNSYIKEHNMFEVYEKFTSLVDEAGIDINFIHLEVILMNMMHFTGSREELATEDIMPEYNIYNISDSVQYGKNSPSKSLIFEYIRKQILTDSFGTFQKTGSSVYDVLLK